MHRRPTAVQKTGFPTARPVSTCRVSLLIWVGYRGVSRGIADILVRCRVWRGGVAVAKTIHFHMVSAHCVCEGRARHYQVKVSRWNRLILYNIKSAAARPSAEPDAIVEFYARVPCRILRRWRARRAALTDEKARGVKAPRTRANATNTIKIR